MISNPKLTGTFDPPTSFPPTAKNEFNNGRVPFWINVFGTSDIVNAAVSPPSTGRVGSWYCVYHEGFGQDVDIISGHTYAVSLMGIRDNTYSTAGVFGTIEIYTRNFTNGSNTINSNWNAAQKNQAIMGATLLSSFQPSNNWEQFSFCFTASQTTDFIFFTLDYTDTACTTSSFWVRIDDVEIFEVEADAGPDKSISCDSSCVWIGKECTPPTLHLDRIFRWYIAGSPTVIDTNATTWVCPQTTTTYVLEVEMESCFAYDSVLVTVLDTTPPAVNLGNDTIVCGPFSVYIDAGYDPDYTYIWNTNETTSSITVNKGGIYTVEVKNANGCVGYGTKTVIARPEFKVWPEDTLVCKYSFPITLRVIPESHDSVRWSNNSTDLETEVYSAGYYWVVVWDSMCHDTGHILVDTIGPPFLFLGADRLFCEGGSDTLCDSNIIRYSKGLIKYLWDTESADTTPCIYVNKSGYYRLLGYTIDSNCVDTASVHVEILTAPEINCPTYVKCLDDPPFTIGSCYTSGGNPLTPFPDTTFIFNPNAYGVGTHYIPFNFVYNEPDPYCITQSVVTVVVNPLPEIAGDTLIVVCVTDPEFVMPFSGDTGGSYSIDGQASDSLFDPAYYGPGSHSCQYRVTNQFGCSDSIEIEVLVKDTFDVWIVEEGISYPCSDEPGILTAKTSDTGSFVYLWNTGAETKSISVAMGGTYWVMVWNKGNGCKDSVSVNVEFVNCCDPEQMEATTVDTFIGNGERIITVNWLNTVKFIDHDIIIMPKTRLNIVNSRIYMRNCSKIIVLGSYDAVNGGRGYLYIDSSVVGICNWQGIEVQGNYDACPQATSAHGKVEIIKHSTISNADIGVFLGKRDANAHEMEYAGGVIKALNSTFRDNYVDVMFTEYSVGGACSSCGPWLSTIESCLFDTLAVAPYCDNYVDNTLSYYHDFYEPPPQQCQGPTLFDPGNNDPPVPVRCHIIDLSPYVEIWESQFPYLCPYLLCRKSYWVSGDPNNPYNENLLYNNIFRGDGCNPSCETFPPHDNYR